jgi:hypothetical protein
MSDLIKAAIKKQKAATRRFELIINFLEQDSPPVPSEVLQDIAHILTKACEDQGDAMMLTAERLSDLEERLMHLSINSNSKN